MPFCEEQGIGVICYSPLMQGLLTGRWDNADAVPTYRARTRHFDGKRPKSRHGEGGHEELLFKTLAAIKQISESSGHSMLDLALSWPLHNPIVASVIAGMTKERHVQSNVDAASVKLSPAVVAQLNEATNELKLAMGSNCDLWQGGENSRCK